MNRTLLRLEALVFLLIALYAYYSLDGSWIMFILLLFVPDLSMAGYLANPRVGAMTYNVVHNYILAALIVVLGTFVLSNELVTLIGIILFAHIALDRTLGLGLKYPTSFKDTHLDRV